MLETILATVLGGAGGALLRLLPEGIGLINTWMKQKTQAADRAHELAVMDKQLEHQRVLQTQKLEEIRTISDSAAELQRIMASVESTKPTGIRIVDIANGLFRPAVSFWIFGIYAMFKTVALVLWAVAMWHEPDVLTQDAWAASFPWFDDDGAMLAGVMAYWFVGRPMEKKAK